MTSQSLQRILGSIISGLAFLSITSSGAFADQVFFEQSSYTGIHLFCNGQSNGQTTYAYPTVRLKMISSLFSSPTLDVYNDSVVQFTTPLLYQDSLKTAGDPLQDSIIQGQSLNPNNTDAGPSVLRFVSAAKNTDINGNTGTTSIPGGVIIGQFVPNPTTFVRQKTITGTGKIDSIVGGSITPRSLTFSGTTLVYELGPCGPDTVTPTITLTNTAHTSGYAGEQTNDRDYTVTFSDSDSARDFGFTGVPDTTSGSNYTGNVLGARASGINSGTVTFTVTIGGQSTGYTLATASSSSATGKTWDRQDRDYKATFSTGILSSLTNGKFPTEQTVTLAASVQDRGSNRRRNNRYNFETTGARSTSRATTFNQGAKPWASATGAGVFGSTSPMCGYGASATIPVGSGSFTMPTTSGAWIIKYNSGAQVQPFDVWLSDDWAGIDTGSITVTFTGTQKNGSPYTRSYKIGDTNFSNTSVLSTSTFTWTNATIPTYATDPANGINGSSLVASASQSRNYKVRINNDDVFAPETPIAISISYSDLRQPARTGFVMNCSFAGDAEGPTNTGSWTQVLERSRSGGQLEPFDIKLEDNRAGIDTGSIELVITGRKANGNTVSPVNVRITSGGVSTTEGSSNKTINDFIASAYTTQTTYISGGQQKNYNLHFAQTGNLAGILPAYFAAEYPVAVEINYKDLAGNNKTRLIRYADESITSGVALDNYTANNPTVTQANVVISYRNQISFLRDWTSPVSTYLDIQSSGSNNLNSAFKVATFQEMSNNGTFATQWPMQYTTIDRWAGVDPTYSKVRIEGTRWGKKVAYEYMAPNSTVAADSANLDGYASGSMIQTGVSIPASASYQYATANTRTSTGAAIANLAGLNDSGSIDTTGTNAADQTYYPSLNPTTGYQYAINTGTKVYFDPAIDRLGVTDTYSQNATGSFDIKLWHADKKTPAYQNPVISNYIVQQSPLACNFNCSFDRLFFVAGTFPNDNPLSYSSGGQTIGMPYTGKTVFVVGSGISIDTANAQIICNKTDDTQATVNLQFAGGALLTGATFDPINQTVTLPYTNTILNIRDGDFQLTGANHDQLIIY